jgi:hypothetical protein
MNEQELIGTIKRKLGEPQIRVELDQTQWEEIILETKKWYLGRKGIVANKMMNILTKQPIKFSAIDPTYGVDSIVDVYFGLDPAVQGMFYDCVFGVFTDGFPIMGSSIFRTHAGLVNSSRYAQLIMALEEKSRVYGAENDWFVIDGDTFDGDDWLVIDGPSGNSISCLIRYKPKFTPSEMQLGWLKNTDIEILTRYALAEAKEILGHIRSKYPSYTTPGGEVTLNGADLLAQAKDEKEKLIIDIDGSQGAMIFVTG